jgi:glycerol uptake facilitator protein
MFVQQLAGGTVKWEQLPVYLVAELLAGVLAALAYQALVKGVDVPVAEPVESPAPASVLAEPAGRV